MKFSRRVGLIAALVCVVAAGCGSQSSGQMLVQDPWVRITNANGALYMTIDNQTSSSDALTDVSVDPSVTESVEMHRTTTKRSETQGGTELMMMESVERIDIPAGGEITLSPGGYHVMLTNIQGQFKPGDKITVTLRFEKSGPQTFEAEVRS